MPSARNRVGMTPEDFKRIALSLEGVEEGSHMGAVDFRVGGHIFATLAHVAKGYGNLMLNAHEQSAFVRELPDVFMPVAGGWGRRGATHIVLENTNEDVLRGGLQTAWRLRVQANARSGKSSARKTPRR